MRIETHDRSCEHKKNGVVLSLGKNRGKTTPLLFRGFSEGDRGILFRFPMKKTIAYLRLIFL